MKNAKPTRVARAGGMFTAALLFAAAQSAPAAAQGRTIVGLWGSHGACARGGDLRIGPMSLRQSELICRFASVARVGDVVTWRGECTLAGDGEGASYFPAKVVAGLADGQLNVVVNDGAMLEFDGHLGQFHRCVSDASR